MGDDGLVDVQLTTHDVSDGSHCQNFHQNSSGPMLYRHNLPSNTSAPNEQLWQPVIRSKCLVCAAISLKVSSSAAQEAALLSTKLATIIISTADHTPGGNSIWTAAASNNNTS